MEMPIEFVIFLGIFLGVLCRTVYPYIKKRDEAKKNNEELRFQMRFVLTAIVSALISTILTFELFVVPEGGGMWHVFIAAFGFSWFADDAMNYLVK